ncbi:MAG: NAD(P)H-hydrate dehydratase, partial [Acidobacteriota bacterium]|nr:NAD(P)H-hydrate dehydratase [Acidobacteriota bacterium]
MIPAMQKVFSAAAMREIDRLTTERYGVPSLLLMEAAANNSLKAIAAHFSHHLPGRSALILCGPGNNGGDGAALARLLMMSEAHADIVLFGRVEATRGDARINFEIVRHLADEAEMSSVSNSGVTIQPASSFYECETNEAWEKIADRAGNYDLIVDALFGTGLTRPLAGVFGQVVDRLALLRGARDRMQQKRPLFVSLDVPSGLNADLAEPIGPAVHSDLTITFTGPKLANILPPAAHFSGRLVIAGVGSPQMLLDADSSSQLFMTEDRDARTWLEQTRYTPDSYKNTHGHALIIAGSRRMTGAAVLSAGAAMRAGAGLVTVATPLSALSSVAARVMPEVMTVELPETTGGAASAAAIEQALKLFERANVVAIGPGLSADEEETRRFVRAIVEQRTTPVVIDADGLNALAPWPDDLSGSVAAPLILTPHEGEMRRLIGSSDRASLGNRVDAVREFAVKHSVILVLKGTRTLIAAPDGRVIVNPTGNAGLGTAGAGDTLTG